MKVLAKHQAWADVAVFEDANAGRALETFLKSRGLPARMYDDKLFRYFLFLRPPRVTFRVQVRQSDLPRTGNLLAAEAPEVLRRALHCQSCASLRVSYPQMTRRFILPTILLHLGIIFRIIEHECYCEHCHFIWNLQSASARPSQRIATPFPLHPAR